MGFETSSYAPEHHVRGAAVRGAFSAAAGHVARAVLVAAEKGAAALHALTSAGLKLKRLRCDKPEDVLRVMPYCPFDVCDTPIERY